MILNGSIDTGLGYGIGASAQGQICIPNFIHEIPKIYLEDYRVDIKELNANSIIIEYKNRYYAVGNYCLTKFPKQERRLNITSRIDDIYHEVQLVTILGFLCKENEYSVNLGVALPNTLKNQLKDYKDSLMKVGTFKFKYILKDTEISKQVTMANVVAMPQPLAPIFTLKKDIRKGKILSLDIGHGTVDATLVDNMIVIEDDGTTLDAEGVDFVYKKLRGLLTKKFSGKPYNKRQFFDKEIQGVIETGKLSLSDGVSTKEVDIKEELDYVMRAYKEYLITKIEYCYRDYIPVLDLLLGTGGILNNKDFYKDIKENIKSNFSKEFNSSEHPQWNVAMGLFKYVNDMFTDDINNQQQQIEGHTNNIETEKVVEQVKPKEVKEEVKEVKKPVVINSTNNSDWVQ